jgi:hypothetical protein
MWCSHSRLIDERALYSASIRQKPLHQAALALDLERVFPERGLSLAAVAHRLLSSISRLHKHRVVPSDVCDAQDPVPRPSFGPEIDVTVAAKPREPLR